MRRCLQVFGLFFLLAAVGLLLGASLTTSWISISHDLDSKTLPVNSSLAYYSRDRGLYRECWDDSNLKQTIENNAYFYSEGCLYMDALVRNVRRGVEYTTQYKERSGVLLGTWVSIGVAGLFMLIALILNVYALCSSVTTHSWNGSCRAIAGLMFAAAFFTILGIALYHGAEYMERKVVKDPNGLMAPYKHFFQLDYPEELLSNEMRTYGFSYALAWLAVACQFLSAVLFVVVSCCYVKKTKAKKKLYSQPSSSYGTAQRNAAYDMSEEVIVVPPKVYIVTDDYYSNNRGTYDPYRRGQLKSSYSPKFQYDRGWEMH